MTLLPRARLDLHMHSVRSDGKHSPEAVLAAAAAGGLDAIALTDHDLPPSLPPGRQQVGPRSVVVIHGVEISAMHAGRELHLLAYFPGEMPASFQDFCVRRARSRAQRYATAIANMGLAGVTEPDAAAWEGQRSLTRYHLAKALVEAGHCATLTDAFRGWVGEDLGYVPALDLDFVDAIAAVREAGGFSSWAHPDLEQAQAWTGIFAAAGLNALEAHRPSIGKGIRDTLARLAFKHRLGVTGGSDWHGWHGSLGAFSVPLRQVSELAKLVALA